MSAGEPGHGAGAPRFVERVYRVLLLAYPAEFRRAYGEEAVRVFAELHREARADGTRAMLQLWRRTVPDVLFAGVGERMSERVSRRGRTGLAGTRAPGDARGTGPDRSRPTVGDVLRDVQLAFRSALRRPGFAVTAVALIALGVGATTTIFSLVDGVLLRPLPYPESARLYRLFKEGSLLPVPDFRDVQGSVRSFEASGAAWGEAMDLTGQGEPERLTAALVTRDLFPLLGARAWRGRLFREEELRPGGPRVVVLSAGLWTRRFGGDPGVIGRTITLSGEPAVVIGVLDPGFVPPRALRLDDADVFLPLDLTRADAQRRTMYVLNVIARLADGVTPAAAQAELDALAVRLAEQYPDEWLDRSGAGMSFEMSSLKVGTVGEVGRALWMFFGAVGLMLLIACANVANLFLARSTEREQEMAVRAALGASRGRIGLQVMTESLSLALVGGVAGTALAVLGVRLFRVMDPGGIPRMAEVAVDARILVFAVTLSGLTGIVFGLVPAWSAGRANARKALRETATRASAPRSRSRVRNTLVVAELGLALMLLAGAGVLFHGFIRLRSVDPGFEPKDLLTAQLDVTVTVPPSGRVAFVDQLLDRMQASPRVRASGLSWRLPFDRGRCCWSTRVTAANGAADTIHARMHPVTPGYFAALGARVLDGRDFTAADRPAVQIPDGPSDTPGPERLVVVVSRMLAERMWPAERAVGRTLSTMSGMQLSVVGVVQPLHHWSLDSTPTDDVYLPFAAVASWQIGLLDIAVRHDGPAAPVIAGLRGVVHDLAPDLPIDRIVAMEDRISGSIATPRFYTALLTTFAVLACLLAAAGVYGSMLYAVGLRRKEMGIRLALGAESGDVIRLVLWRGMGLVMAGTVLGLAGTAAATRVLRSLVYEVSVTDPFTLGLAAAFLATSGLLACWLPARRAARVDPIAMLRAE